MSLTAPVQAFDQNSVVSLIQNYQQLCGRMIAAPEVFHQDPGSNFGIPGEVEFAYTEDRASVDYVVIAPSPVTPEAEREHVLVSIRNGSLLEQSCSLTEGLERVTPQDTLAQLAGTFKNMISNTEGFTLSGGKMIGSAEFGSDHTYFFTVTGMFVSEYILTLLTLHPQFIAVEHTHISTLD